MSTSRSPHRSRAASFGRILSSAAFFAATVLAWTAPAPTFAADGPRVVAAEVAVAKPGEPLVSPVDVAYAPKVAVMTAAGATLTAEACSPPLNTAVDPGEQVTVGFGLQNTGTTNTSNLVATLQGTGGVTPLTGPQNYGVVVAGGPSVSRPFTFVATGTCGATFTATLSLQDGATALGNVTFNFTFGTVGSASTTFTNNTRINVPAVGTTSGVSSPYPSSINVTGLTGTITSVTARFNGFTHTFPDDVDIVLIGPAGQSVLLMSDTGGSLDINNVTLTFDDAAATSLPDSTQITTGTFRPTNIGAGDTFAAPAPAGPYGATLSVFNGTNPNGMWRLFAVDDTSGDVGNMATGYSLTITTTLATCCVNNNNPGALQFSSATYSVNENGGSATITVSRVGGSSGTVGVSYATSNGTATAGSDYTATSGTLTFLNGETTKTFSVPILDDFLAEPNETVNLTLSNPTGGAALGITNPAVLTIVNVPKPGALQFGAATFSVQENGGSATITVTRANGSEGTVAVNYATSDGTATAGADYTATSGTLTFLDGENSKAFSVPILDDFLAEPNETVNLSLSNPTGGAALGTPSTAVLTIVNVPKPGALQFGAATFSVQENGGSATITVTRSNGSEGIVTVNYASSDGTATAGADYTASSGTLTFLDAETSKTFSLPILDDFLAEPNETVNLALSNPTGGATLGAPSTAVLTIVNVPKPGALQFSSATYSVNEDGGSATITVTRGNGDEGTVAVNYATSDGTATAGGDYGASSGTLTFLSGESSKTFAVPILDDFLAEPAETVNLALSAPTGGATLGSPSSAVLTIVNVPKPGVLQFSSAGYSIAEDGGSATITVTRSNGDEGTVAVNYATADGTATAGSDYSAALGTLTFLSGETSKTFVVPVLDDFVGEPSETVDLALSAPTGGATLGAPSAATLTIINVPKPGQLQFNAAIYSVDENGGSVTIAVTRSSGNEGSVTVAYATANGTASAGADYTASSGTLTFGDGVTSQTFVVPILDDQLAEPTETVDLALSAPGGGATLGTPSTAVLDIVNVPKPGQLQFSAATYSANEDGGTATITVTRSNGDEGAVTVDYATSDGSAAAGSDYTATSGTLTLGNGVTSGTFTVPILDDFVAEPSETVNLALGNPGGGATLGTPTAAVLTIVNIPDPGVLQFSAATYSVNEDGGSATITVTRGNGSEGAVTVDYATSNGSASAGSDYTATSGTLSFADSMTSQTFTVAVSSDLVIEGAETINLALTNPGGGATLGATSSAVLTIVDVPPSADLSVTIADAPDPVAPGADVTYAITVDNAGPTGATGVALSSPLPSNATFVSLAPAAGWSCTTPTVGSAGTVGCTIAVLPTPATASFTLVARANPGLPAGAVLNAAASLTATSADPDGSDNSASTTTGVVSPASVTGTMTAQGFYVPGGGVAYRVVLANGGLDQADNPGPEFIDVLPPELNLLSAVASSGTAAATPATRTVTWDGAIPAGGSVVITIGATILPTAPPGITIVNQGEIRTDVDGNGSNETQRFTDNPNTPTVGDGTAIVLGLGGALAPIPMLANWARLLLAVLLGGLALAALRRRSPRPRA